jgi:acetylornithine deacetylase/succinyl-diaminopimelate desuccinylase family protein
MALRFEDLVTNIREHLDPEFVIGLTRELVTVPSHTAEGEERAAAVLEAFFNEAGVPTTRQQVADAGVNVIATLPSETGQVGLLFNGHLDVVPPSSAMPFPPFTPTLRDGQMWGRGTVDMKGGMAAMACALAAVRAAGVPLKRSVMLSAVAAEERGNLGTAALVRSGVQAEWAVVGEATGLDLIVAHKGVDRYQVIVEGQSAHESMPELGVNAIIYCARIITALHDSLWPRVKERVHPTLGAATYNIGTIQGGISRNMVPDRCVFQIAKRYLPGDSPDAIRAELENAIAACEAEPGSRVSVVREPEFDRIPHPPLEVDPDHPLPRALSATAARLTGRTPRIGGWAAFTDGALLQVAGIPAVIFGPGDVSLAHTDEERITLSEVATAAEIYACLAAAACGSEEITGLFKND